VCMRAGANFLNKLIIFSRNLVKQGSI